MAGQRADLAQTFVQLADTLVEGFDVIDLLTVLTTRCVELLDAEAAGILLADEAGALHVVAASSERVRLLELFQIQNEEGPCHECFLSGRAVLTNELDDGRWPRFGPEATAAGYRSVQALPLRLRRQTIGALNIFRTAATAPSAESMLVAQAMADAATIGILHDAAMREAQLLAVQLQSALDSRIAVEQAKGIIAERHGLDMDDAFGRLRAFARDGNLRLSTAAADVVAGTLRV
jgi:transcriptional regulator with GAF, ATPase, and Fis domain